MQTVNQPETLIIAQKYTNSYCEDPIHNDLFSDTIEYFIPSKSIIARFIMSGSRKGEIAVVVKNEPTNLILPYYSPDDDEETLDSHGKITVNPITEVKVSSSFVDKIIQKKNLQDTVKEIEKTLFLEMAQLRD